MTPTDDEKIDTDWKIVSATVSDCGKFMEVSFKSTRNRSTHTARVTADTWLKGTWAEWKLAEFQEALKKAVDILEGRR